MKFQITLGLLGKKDFDATIAASNGRMRISNKHVVIEGPALPGMESAQGAGSTRVWEQYLAGLSQTLIETDYTGETTNFRSYSKSITGDFAAAAAAMPTFLKIAKKESPRNYGAVIQFTNKHAVATDGFRLSWCDLDLAGLPDAGITLPTWHAKVAGMALEHADEVLLAEDATTLYVVAKGYTFAFRLSAVKYPNWRGVLPQKPQSVTVDLESVKEQAATLVRLKSSKTEATTVLIEGKPFNAAFVRDLPAAGSVAMDHDGEVLLVTGPVNMVLVASRAA